MGDLKLRRTGHGALVAFHSEPMVLRRDQNFARLDLFHGMITSAVTIRHLRGGPAKCETEKLVAETDAKRWYTAFYERADGVLSVGYCRGITGAVREEDSVG